MNTCKIKPARNKTTQTPKTKSLNYKCKLHHMFDHPLLSPAFETPQCFLCRYHIPSAVSREPNLKDKCVVLYEVFYSEAGAVVLPICLEQCGAEDDSQVVEVHLVELRETLHTETHAEANTHL